MGSRTTFISCFVLSLIALISSQTTVITTDYTGQLTSVSSHYNRDGGNGGSYYYEAIEFRVGTTGTYTFKTSSSISDTYGYIYQGNFYPTYPSYNIVARDDDSAGSNQFQLTATLRADLTYILIFTTYGPGSVGTFSISATGPDYVFYSGIDIATTDSYFTSDSTYLCQTNEVSYENHCYFLDGIGGQCPAGYSIGSEAVLATIANSFIGLNYKTAISDNCCIITTDTLANYGMSGQCNAQGPFTAAPTLHGSGCTGVTGRRPRQLTFCVSN